ncbi:hypothetical protein ACLB2K_033222 [Fragaria x ananassa]
MSAPEGPFPASISFQNCKNLRTLTTFNCKVSAIDSTLISQLRCLRTLHLSHNDLHELPDNIGDLIHLSALKELPKSMGKLINLRHLYIQLCDQLNYLPKEIGRLTSLQTLDICPVYGSEDDEVFKLGDLGSLDRLQGTLTIKVLGDWKDANEAENAQIKWYDGTTWPHWMMSLYNLRVLSLDSCYCKFLPPLGKLPFLEKLSVSYTRVRKIGVEFLGIEEAQTSIESSRRAILFPKLKELLFWRLNDLEEWNGMEGWKEEDSDITIMPCLSSLRIMDCRILHMLPDYLRRSNLQSLEIIGSWMLARCCEEGTGSEWPKISHIPNIKIEYPDRYLEYASNGYIQLL